MALDTKTLESDIYDALIKAFSSDDLPAEAKEDTEQRYAEFAKELKNAISAFVKSGTVSTNVTTAVNTSTSTGVGTGTGSVT